VRHTELRAIVEQRILSNLGESRRVKQALLGNHALIETIAVWGQEMARALSLPAIVLSGNISILTATGNDYTYDAVFSRHVEAPRSAGDIAIGISTWGRSPSVTEDTGREEAPTVDMIVQHGRGLALVVDHCVRIPSKRTSRTEGPYFNWTHHVRDRGGTAVQRL